MKHASLAIVRRVFLLFVVSQFPVAVVADPDPSATAQPAAPPKRTLKPEDFAALRDVVEPNISRDGNLVTYVVKTVDMENDKLTGNLWVAKWDGIEQSAASGVLNLP